MSMRTRPPLLPHVAAIGALALTVWLAMWQFDRAEYKRELTAGWSEAPLRTLDRDLTHSPIFTRVTATGRFDQQRQLLLDNQVRNGQAGVHVFTPFRPDNQPSLWLVNRGWHSFNRLEQRLPNPDIPTGTVTISGRLGYPPEPGLKLGGNAVVNPDQWPNLMTYLDLGPVAEVFPGLVSERIILLDPAHPAHLTGDPWQPVVFGPDRHRAYAWQWLTMALVIALIWITLTIRSFKTA